MGQLGNGTISDTGGPSPVLGLSNAIAVSANTVYSTCALLADGTIQCWGSNHYGQLGDATTTDSPVPVTVLGISNATAIALGTSGGLALLRDGTVETWGGNSAPALVSGVSTGVAISASCIVLGDGTVECWDVAGGPVVMPGITNAIAVAGPAPDCALLGDGTVICWDTDGVQATINLD